MSRLPYLRAGSGPVLVLVHGYLGGAAQWVDEIETFGKDFDVIAPSLPGFGEAAHLQACGTIHEMAVAVLELLGELEVTDYILLGHSMGGQIAQEMAALRPEMVNKLILYGTGPVGLMPDRFEPITVSQERLQQDGVAKTIERIAATWFKNGEQAAGYAKLVEIGSLASPEAALLGLDAMAGWDGRDALNTLSMPTLVIWGDSDRSYRWPQVESLWQGIPSVDLCVVPKCSHAIHLEKPALFHSIIGDFLCGTYDGKS